MKSNLFPYYLQEILQKYVVSKYVWLNYKYTFTRLQESVKKCDINYKHNIIMSTILNKYEINTYIHRFE